MSLFKSQISDSYNLVMYKDDYLIVHCSKNHKIHAPFSGKIKATKDGCVLYNDNFKLYFTHMKCDTEGEVANGDAIGVPVVGHISNVKLYYIGVKLYYRDELQDVLVYFRHQDKDVKDEQTIEVAEKKPQKKKK